MILRNSGSVNTSTISIAGLHLVVMILRSAKALIISIAKIHLVIIILRSANTLSWERRRWRWEWWGRRRREWKLERWDNWDDNRDEKRQRQWWEKAGWLRLVNDGVFDFFSYLVNDSDFLLGQWVKIWNTWTGHLLTNRPDPFANLPSLTNRLTCWPISPACWPTGQSVGQAKIISE